MPRKSATSAEESEETKSLNEDQPQMDDLSRMLAAVLNYLSDDEIEEIDIEYLFEHTEGLREWWDQYRERNRKLIEQEIKNSLSNLSLEELESIHEKVKNK